MQILKDKTTIHPNNNKNTNTMNNTTLINNTLLTPNMMNNNIQSLKKIITIVTNKTNDNIKILTNNISALRPNIHKLANHAHSCFEEGIKMARKPIIFKKVIRS